MISEVVLGGAIRSSWYVPILYPSLTRTFNVSVVSWELISTVGWGLIPSLASLAKSSFDTSGIAPSLPSGGGCATAARSSTCDSPTALRSSYCQSLAIGSFHLGVVRLEETHAPVHSTYSGGGPSARPASQCSRRNLASWYGDQPLHGYVQSY